jgi:membrane-bound lytic murein transglycosylase B
MQVQHDKRGRRRRRCRTKKPLFVENLDMYRIRMAALALVVSVATAGMTAPVAMAQTTDTAASTPKQVQKAQRKADRKAARTKKNAELKDLEKNGYNPAGDQTNYPQNIQNAEKKSAAAKAASAP